MAIVTKTPGVYIEEVPLFPPSIAAVDTAVPVFIGYTDTRPDNARITAVKIRTLMEFEQKFCNWDNWKLKFNVQDNTWEESFSRNELYYHLQLYFANGGGKCYIASLGPKKPEGVEKKDFEDALAVIEKEDEPTLILAPEAVQLPYADYLNFYQQALAQAARLMDRFVIIDIPETKKDEIENFRNGLGVNNLKYGAAYYPYLQTSIAKYASLDDEDISLVEPSAAAAPPPAPAPGDAPPPERKPKPPVNAKMETGSIRRQEILLRLKSEMLVLPPSAAIAGVYANVDATRGVWKAPANVSLNAVSGLTRKISHEEQAELNVHAEGGKSINAIRAFTGLGILVWGARTLAGNDNEWKYVNVRRFYNFVEESIKKATQVFIFEPNDANTWVRISTMIENFLTNLWRQGALAGAAAGDAFYVRIGLGVTMSSEDILNGILNVEIGLAVVRPTEFLVLRFTHKMQEI
ncbi:phage tail sheath family protein [Dyadobacter flavalbus]|uniref:Phage tail sheath family protein n=1 Tax=Dyadobacter flavalbus TaxID=2579942 RepID=A0A5M8QTE8_9BACT|nr:phage tail sheath C-terminal domain-containing protein [Dyadobacter flavalbus]KAA6439409.1 phage tail sheath family protein [Dyadobacter flavalbus]